MLKRLGPSVVSAKDATSLAPFPSRLEFNPPAHGMWNIVHVGMLVPEAHQVYVCAINCMRGVVLTAAEMGASDRFSCVVLKEEDITRGTVEEVTRQGVADVLHKLEKRGALPPCVIVFPVCTHHFLGVNMAHVYRELEREFPRVDFVRAYMDPIMKRRLSPDQRLRKAMFDPLEACEPDGSLVACLGSDFALRSDCELFDMLQQCGCRLVQLQDCGTYEEFKGLARAHVLICTYPNAAYGMRKLAARLGRDWLYLPSCFGYDEIRAQYEQLRGLLEITPPNLEREVTRCDEALARARAAVGDAAVAIDASVHPRPLGLARLLLEHGFDVTEVYLDAINPEEEADLAWLRAHAPSLELSSIVLPELRVAPRARDREVLAIGQKAAWFTGTSHFVNIVEGEGLWGFAGIRAMAGLIQDAAAHEKDAKDLIPRKGLGCASCF